MSKKRYVWVLLVTTDYEKAEIIQIYDSEEKAKKRKECVDYSHERYRKADAKWERNGYKGNPPTQPAWYYSDGIEVVKESVK